MHRNDTMSPFARAIMLSRYAMTFPDGRVETWPEIAQRVVTSVLGAAGYGPEAPETRRLIYFVTERKFMPGGRYLYASGREYHQTQNCLLLRAQDTREGWGDLMHHVTLSLMTGAGLGVNYSLLRGEGSSLGKSGGTSSGPMALMQMVNEVARGARQGGARRGAIWAGLNWSHSDIFTFINAKNWSEDVKRLKLLDFNFPATLDHTNISVGLDDSFFTAYHNPPGTSGSAHVLARSVYETTVRQMCETGEPGFSVDIGPNAGEDLRNACTEVTSRDDSDICNLGSINLARVESLKEMRELVNLGTLFLLAGTIYSDLPYKKVGDVREKNRRLGLGLMGIHEFLLVRGEGYRPSEWLGEYLDEYAYSDAYAHLHAHRLGVLPPVKTRAIAPNGTIGIVAETTTSAEPIFCVAYKRRYRDGETWKHQYVVDPTAARLIAQGVSPAAIEDAYTISPGERIAFQAWLQEYVDHSISSTVNLPPWGSETNNESTVGDFGKMLMGYLPSLRGITVYPDGARGGQPLTRVPYAEAVERAGITYVEEAGDVCELTRGGGCG